MIRFVLRYRVTQGGHLCSQRMFLELYGVTLRSGASSDINKDGCQVLTLYKNNKTNNNKNMSAAILF